MFLQGENSGTNPPHPTLPLSSAPTPAPFLCAPPLPLFLHPLCPSVPVLPEALRDDTKSQFQTGPLARSACLVHHMSWQMGLPWTLPWTHRRKKKKNDIGTQMWWWWWGVRSCGLHELSSRVEQKKSALLQFKDLAGKKWYCCCGRCAVSRRRKKNVNNRYIKRDPWLSYVLGC